ncbi:putative F-box domain-containing protein [Tanacetum coccineum]
MMSSNLPLKIQVEIMKRFPVKSLIRFKSVSKAWKLVIDSSKFISDYNAACRHPQHYLVVTCPNYKSKEEYVSIVDDDTFPLCKLSHTIPSSSFNLLDIQAIFGSSQGMFCFYGYKCGIGLMADIWNPSIRKSVDIVLASKLNYRPPMNKFVVGFGVCHRTFDPMLVKITYIQTVDTLTGYNPTQVEVFTLISGAWKSQSTNLPRESVQFPHDYCIDLDGFIYWLAIDKVYDESHNNVIMSFDNDKRKFCRYITP